MILINSMWFNFKKCGEKWNDRLLKYFKNNCVKYKMMSRGYIKNIYLIPYMRIWVYVDAIWKIVLIIMSELGIFVSLSMYT